MNEKCLDVEITNDDLDGAWRSGELGAWGRTVAGNRMRGAVIVVAGGGRRRECNLGGVRCATPVLQFVGGGDCRVVGGVL